MNIKVIKRILKTINNYVSCNKFDGVYIKKAILDLLVDDLKEAIHCDDIRNEDCKKE